MANELAINVRLIMRKSFQKLLLCVNSMLIIVDSPI